MQEVPSFEFEVATNPHGRYCVPKEYLHRPVPQMLMRGEIYEPETQEFLAGLSASGDIICGGAFVGDFLPRLERAVRPGGLVHTFEPNPTSLAATRHTIGLNGLKSCVLHPCGIGAAEDVLHLMIAKPSGKAMAARARLVAERKEGQTVEVPIRPLDDLIPENRPIAALQLDIEGHEPEAIRGAQRIVRENAPVILVEAERPWEISSYQTLLNDLFPDLGYSLDRQMERNCVFVAADR